MNKLKEEPMFMINLTNDSWYGKTSEPEQHLFLAKWRAVEFNIPILRSTNTGITLVVFPDGSESQRTKIFEEDILKIDLSLNKREKTFYQKWGVGVSFLVMFLITLGIIFFNFFMKPFFNKIVKT